MAQSLQQLLPAPEDTVRCAEHARAIAVDPGGTAIRADRIVLVAVPLPWPKPALDHPRLVGIRDELAAAPIPTRLLASVPARGGGDTGGRGGDDVAATVYDRVGGSAIERRFRLPSAEALVELGRALAAGGPSSDLAQWLVAESEPARPAVLVCTQGSHDVCCGSEGVRLADELDDLGLAVVHRVSHTGGHRFAPTVMTLPDGRMWAGVDPSLVVRAFARQGDPAALTPRCRGWWGAATGPAQVAERAVLAEHGWALDGADRQVAVVDNPTTGRVVCTVTTGSATWEVRLTEGRAVPTIACRQPGGLPAKPGREYDVVSVAQIPPG